MRPPHINVIAADAQSFRIQIETGQRQLPDAAPLLYCSLFSKPKFGEWRQDIFPARNLDFVNLRALQCGQWYEIYATCHNGFGVSAESVRLEGVQTLGGKPNNPMLKSPSEVVHPTNDSVRLDLFMWNNDLCPVEYFVISYKKENVTILSRFLPFKFVFSTVVFDRQIIGLWCPITWV